MEDLFNLLALLQKSFKALILTLNVSMNAPN